MLNIENSLECKRESNMSVRGVHLYICSIEAQFYVDYSDLLPYYLDMTTPTDIKVDLWNKYLRILEYIIRLIFMGS